MDSLKVTDNISKAVQKTPNRVALADIEAAIASEYVLNAHLAVELYGSTAADELRPLTICLLVMKNGFTVIGKSAPADPANYDPNVGAKFAREDAIRQLWPLMGFSLRDRLAVEA